MEWWWRREESGMEREGEFESVRTIRAREMIMWSSFVGCAV